MRAARMRGRVGVSAAAACGGGAERSGMGRTREWQGRKTMGRIVRERWRRNGTGVVVNGAAVGTSSSSSSSKSNRSRRSGGGGGGGGGSGGRDDREQDGFAFLDREMEHGNVPVHDGNEFPIENMSINDVVDDAAGDDEEQGVVDVVDDDDDDDDDEEDMRTAAEVRRLKKRFTQRRHEGIARLRERRELRTSSATSSSSDAMAAVRVSSQNQDVDDLLEMDHSVDPRTLKRGEFIVHEKIGIGIFEEIVSVGSGNRTSIMNSGNGVSSSAGQEYVVLRFQDGLAKLKMESACGSIYRYFAHHVEGEKEPKLNRLKDRKAWQRRFRKARLSVQDMVVGVMDTYIQRLSRTRSPYESSDCSAFDASFEHRLTSDQCAAVSDIERDLFELDSPMDRLIIGDVGFGKTEVALRAIYRACAAGKQVFVLSPTTVLAEQHHRVMSARLAPFGFTTSLMCRYIGASDRRKIKAGIEDGRIDVCIATHTLLSSGVEPRRLGMVVIDEEQKFGVRQKEFLKTLRTASDVDVLTLSATPIPRTLHLSLSGFKDASLIVTPPPGRLSVDTTVCKFDREVVTRAISRELERGGQVFYVTSRVARMADVQARLEADFPDVTVGVVHGKLSPAAMEKAMEGLRSGEINVMVCTTVVESGIDVPNVNTVIVENVHMFGLSTLYQIRGRVGRSTSQAYALFTWPESMDITAPDKQAVSMRLKALSECTGLGEGFQLAERDMAIRGIGNVFGEKQSGHLDNIGSDYYVKILCEQLARVEKCFLPEVAFDDVELQIPYADTGLPLDFLGSDGDRADFAHDLRAAAKAGILKKFLMYQYQVHSSFPPAVLMFIKVLSIRKVASDLGIHRIAFSKEYRFYMYSDMPEETWLILVEGAAATGEPVIPGPVRRRLSFEKGPDANSGTSSSSSSVIVLAPNEDDMSPAQYLQSLYTALRLLKKSRPDFVKYV